MAVPTPPVVTQAFAQDASTDFKTVPIPENGAAFGRATLDAGFPAETFNPIVGGGVPPDGRDFNGLFNISFAHHAYAQSGQPYKYVADIPAAVTGYGLGAVLGQADGKGLWFNLSNNNAADPDVAGTGWAPLYTYGHLIIAITGGMLTLTALQARFDTIVFQGVLTQNEIVTFPNRRGRWLIVNQCTGSFTLTVKGASQAGGVVIPQGGYASPMEVYSADDDNLYPAVAPVTLPLSIAPTPLSIVQRSEFGFVYATFFNQNSGLENFAVSSVIAQQGVDGFNRKISIANLAPQIPINILSGQVANGQVGSGAVTQHSAALFTNAALTGTPTAPTAAAGTSTNQIASTAFVAAANTKRAGITMTMFGATISAFNASGVRTSMGTYQIDVSAAGFTQLPVPVAVITVPGINNDTIYAEAISVNTIIVRTREPTSPIDPSDRPFNLIVLGV